MIGLRRAVTIQSRWVRGVGAVAIAGFFALATGCGNFYFADIQGFIVDNRTDQGINGVEVRLFYSTPTSTDDADFFARSSTTTQGGNAGYFGNRVIWENFVGRYGSEGDTNTIHLVLRHADYVTQQITMPGILSDTMNTIPEIRLVPATRTAPSVRGQVVDVNGNGLNGVRVVLNLSSTTDETEDYVVNTATVNDQPGIYEFEDVTWRPAADATTAAASSEPATISVVDNQYQSTTTVSVTLIPEQEHEINDTIVATRAARTAFSTTVTGRIVERLVQSGQATRDVPARGIEVTVSFQDVAAGGSVTARELTAQTNADGVFTIFVEWTDTTPRDYDAAGSGTTTADTTIPEGEDGLLVTIEFNKNSTSSLDLTSAKKTDFKLRSWLNPNTVPDVVVRTTIVP